MNTMRKSFSGLFLICLTAGLIAACGSNSVDQAGAAKATAAALTASQMTEAQVRAGIMGGATSGLKVQASAGQFTASGTVTNPQGGSLDLTAQGTYAMDGSYTYSASLTFNNWKDAAQNLTLNGKLSESISATVSGGTTTAQATYTGDLQVAGTVNGTATYNLTVQATTSGSGSCVTESGQVSGFGIDVKVGC